MWKVLGGVLIGYGVRAYMAGEAEMFGYLREPWLVIVVVGVALITAGTIYERKSGDHPSSSTTGGSAASSPSPTTAHCGRCQQRIPAGDAFCASCGAPARQR